MGNVILSFLAAQPFVPFRITISDRSTYDVADPGMAEVSESVVRLSRPVPGTPTGREWAVTISLLHITCVETAEQDYPIMVPVVPDASAKRG